MGFWARTRSVRRSTCDRLRLMVIRKRTQMIFAVWKLNTTADGPLRKIGQYVFYFSKTIPNIEYETDVRPSRVFRRAHAVSWDSRMLDRDLALACCSRIRRDRGIPGATADHRLHRMPPIPVVRNEHEVRRPRAKTVRKLSISVLKTKPLCLRGQSANSWIDHENSKKLHSLCYFLGPLCCIHVCVKFFSQFPLYSCNFILRRVRTNH